LPQNEGNGHDLALAICGQVALPDCHPNAAIGDVPAPWNSNIEAYQLEDVFRLVIFYNDDFGINAGDHVSVRRRKVLAWLVEE
jgi:hypothetical protein